MSYITKYRPSKFEDVIGQDGVVASFEKALKDRTAKAFLIDGPSGCGKTTLARIAAHTVGCKDKDIQEIDAATYSGIDDMRQITSTLCYRPIGGEVKSLIVDECHALSKAAWDSLLKVLEEPPEHVFWFLCTTTPAKVPQTIMTRCARYQLKAVPEKLLVKLLDDVAAAEGILKGRAGEDIIDLCASEAGGSPRQALANLALCAAAKNRDEASDLMASAVDSVEAIDLAKGLLKGIDWREACDILAKLKDANGESVRQVVRAYITAVALGSGKNAKQAERCMAILDAFSQPCAPGEQLTPIVLSVGRLMFAN